MKYSPTLSFLRWLSARLARRAGALAVLGLLALPAAAQAQPNNALAFDGTNDAVTIPRPVQNDFTLEYWVNTTQTGRDAGPTTNWYDGNGIVDAEVNGRGDDFGTALMGSKVVFGTGFPDISIRSVTAVNDGRWHHVAATRERATGTLKLYVDGRLEATGTGTSTAALTGPPNLVLGGMQSRITDGYFRGRLDEVRIWNTVRSAAGILATYRAATLAPQAGLVAYYPCNQGVAGGNNAGLTTLLDAAGGTGFNGALTGFALTGTVSNWVGSFPTLASIAPASGAAGSTVALTGTNLTGATAVTFAGTANNTVTAGFTVSPDGTRLTGVVVPGGAATGNVTVTTPEGTTNNPVTFTVVAPNPAPAIASLSPNTAVAGSASLILTIVGTGFVAGSAAAFNGGALVTDFVSATQLTATVPASALATAGAYGVVVTNPAPGGGASAPASFTVTAPAPTITAFTPGSGPVGTAVTLTGTGFTGATAVRIGTLAAPGFVVVSATSITFAVPAGATTGQLSVVTPAGTATSGSAFTVTVASASAAGQPLTGLAVFPNPAHDQLTVRLPQPGGATAALRDLTGRLVLAAALLPATGQLALPAALASGVYLLEVRQGRSFAVRRIAVQ